MRSVSPKPDAFAEFARLQRARYPDSEWSQCEFWMESDWNDFSPDVSWISARVLDLRPFPRAGGLGSRSTRRAFARHGSGRGLASRMSHGPDVRA